MSYFGNFSKEQIREINGRRLERMKTFNEIREIDYCGKRFVIHPYVFIPFVDSEPMRNSIVINKSESVLDVCTGSGIIAILCAYNGAGSVVAEDISRYAVACAEENSKKHSPPSNRHPKIINTSEKNNK